MADTKVKQKVRIQDSKMFIFLKENAVVLLFFFFWMIFTGLFWFLNNLQTSYIKEMRNNIDDKVSKITQARTFIEKYSAQKIKIINDVKGLNKYSVAIDVFDKYFGLDNAKISLNDKWIGISKIVFNNISASKIKEFTLYLIDKKYRVIINKMPDDKNNKFNLSIK